MMLLNTKYMVIRMNDEVADINRIHEAENLLERERIEAEHTRHDSEIESEKIILKTLTESENHLLKTLTESENLITEIVMDNVQLKKDAAIKLESLKHITEIMIKNLKESASIAIQNIKNDAVAEFETLQKLAAIEAAELKRIARIDYISLKNVQNIENKELLKKTQNKSFDVMTYARLLVETRKQKAIATSEELKRRAHEKYDVLVRRAKTISEQIKTAASMNAENIKEQAKNYSLDLIRDSHRYTMQVKSAEVKIQRNQTLKLQNKTKLSILITSIIIAGMGIFYLSTNVDHRSESFTTGYVIQNLKGDTVDTFVSWKKPPDAVFHIHVINSKYVTKERSDAIQDIILSQQKIVLDDSLTHKGVKGTNSTYYVGWHGALNSITDSTKFNIIKNLHFHIDEGVATGDIEIELTNLSSPDGYSGYTKSIVDESNHQILKSTITIYDIERISLEDLKTILRHELGHGFGLAHSTAPEDLMAPVITTNYPYISECDLDAIRHLYDGGESSMVTCEK